MPQIFKNTIDRKKPNNFAKYLDVDTSSKLVSQSLQDFAGLFFLFVWPKMTDFAAAFHKI